MDSLFDLLTVQYAVNAVLKYYALARVFEMLDERVREGVRGNLICSISEERVNTIEEKVRKGEVDDDLAADIIALTACLIHAFNAAGLGDIVDAVMQLAAVSQKGA